MDLSMKKASPYAIVLEEPAPRGVELSFENDGELSGKIIGINSTPEQTSYPKICVVSLKTPADARVSCVTAEKPHRPHPHMLVQECGEKNSDKPCNGIVKAQVNPHFPVTEFNDMKLQYVPREGVKEALALRPAISMNPSCSPPPRWKDSEINEIDLNSVRLCFQVSIKNSIDDNYYEIVPIVSEPIYLDPPRSSDA